MIFIIKMTIGTIKLLEDITNYPFKSAEILLEDRYFYKITYVISQKPNNLNEIDEAMTIIIILFNKIKDYNLSIKLINNIYKSGLFDHIAKSIYGRATYINTFRNLVASLVSMWNNLNLENVNKILFVKCIERLLLKSLWTRHMFLSIIKIDILIIKNIRNNNHAYMQSKKEIELSDIPLTITDKTPKYIKEWYGSDSNHIIYISYLDLLPRILCEIKPDNYDILKRMCNKIAKVLNICKSEIKSKIITNIIKSCNHLNPPLVHP